MGGFDQETYGTEIMAAIKTDGTLWVWGNNENGALGQNSPAPAQRSSPTQIPGTTWSKVTNTAAKGFLALKTDGTLWGWGTNGPGQLGQNNRTAYSSPIQVPGTDWSNKGALGYNRTFAIKTNGELWSWGYNAPGGHLGHNDIINYSSPVQIPGTWNSVLASHTHTYAIKKLLAD